MPALAVALLLATGGCVGPARPKDPLLAAADARKVLLQAVTDAQPLTRAHAMEAVAGCMKAAESGPILLKALGDANPAVRFAAAMGLGDVRYAPARPALTKMASDKALESDRRVYCAVIYALHTFGDDTHAPQLVKLLADREKEVRAQAALAMGKMGEVSAIGPLKTLLGDERDAMVELQVVESLALLGDEGSLLRLEAYAKRPFLDERLVAVGAMARCGSVRAVPVLQELLDRPNPTRLRAAAAGAMARLGHVDRDGYRLCARAAENPRQALGTSELQGSALELEAQSLQQIAAISLGWMGDRSAIDVLQPLLASPSGAVRVAAAMSILRLTGSESPAPQETG